MKLKYISLLSANLLLVNTLSATSTVVIDNSNAKTYNEIDNGYEDESGFAFYQDDKTDKQDTKKKHKNKKCDCNHIMETIDKMLKESKKQTKIQQKILDLISNEIDPKPKIITVNGKKCIENSSAECFKMPITSEAKKTPALKAWMENPSIENTVTYLRWQSKFFKEVFKRGDSFPMAIAEQGSKAYPMLVNDGGYIDLFGYSPVKQAKNKLMIEQFKKIPIFIFFGLNKDLDLVSIVNLKELIKKYKNLDITIVFENEHSKELFDSVIEGVYGTKKSKELFYGSKIMIDSSLSKELNVYTTPAILVNDNDKPHIIYTGALKVSAFERAAYRYLEFNDKIDHEKLYNYNMWDKDVDFKQKYFEREFNIDINKVIK